MKQIAIIPVLGDRGIPVEMVQIQLNQKGFTIGNIDGVFGNQTKNAIAHFQSSQNLKDDGVLTLQTLALLGLEVETELNNNPLLAIASIVDRSKTTRLIWENGNRGKAPHGYYYGMAMTYANLYERLKNGEPIAKALAQPLHSSKDKDALTRFKSQFTNQSLGQLSTDTERLRGLFVLLFGLGLMESNGRYCCGWDRGKLTGWGKPSKKIEPTAANSEAGLFQTSYDILQSIDSATKNLMTQILANYNASQEGFLYYFSKGYIGTVEDWDTIGSGVAAEFQKLSKECPAFTVEFTAMALRHVARHWNPVIHVGNSEKGLQLKKECHDLLLKIERYVDGQTPIAPLADTTIQSVMEPNLKQLALEKAALLGQEQALKRMFEFAPESNANFWAVVDYSKPRTEKRLFIFDLKNKTVSSYQVAHGKKSGDLYATDFSNEVGSNKSCLGIFKTGSTYIGANGRSLYLDGLESTNSNTRKRYIVIHQSEYVTDDVAGRSLGCFVVSPKYSTEVINNLKDGSYLIAWTN